MVNTQVFLLESKEQKSCLSWKCELH